MKRIHYVFMFFLVASASGCTVKPLYSDGPAWIGSEAGAAKLPQEMASIAISEPETRVGQEVRNHLIFMFGQGQGQPSNPRYSLTLTVSTSVVGVLRAPVTTGEQRPSAAILRAIGTYTLTEVASGATIAAGKREISSSFDRPRQEFSEQRAQRDAENRAARELAELLRLDISAKMASRG